MGFEIHHGVLNTPWGQNCMRGGWVAEVVMGFELHHGLEIHHGVRNAIWGGRGKGRCVCVCVCV